MTVLVTRSFDSAQDLQEWASGSEPAALQAALDGPYTVSGLTLKIAVDGAGAVTVTFTGTDPLTVAAVVTKIESLLPGIASVQDGKRLLLTSTTLGAGSSVQVTDGTANSAFGWPDNTTAVGRDPIAQANTQQIVHRDRRWNLLYWQ